MITKYPERKYRRGVSYVTVGIKEPRIKNSGQWTPELRKTVAERATKMWANPEKKREIINVQIQRKHPWRQAFTLFGKPSPNYEVR